MGPYLEYAYIVKQLAHISNPNPAFKVKISTPGDLRDFKIGQRVVYNVFLERDCYLYMLNLDSQGNFQVIFPNQYYETSFFRAGTRQIPDQDMKRYFNFELCGTGGEETVKIIATNSPLDLQALSLTRFQEMFPKSPGKGGSSGCGGLPGAPRTAHGADFGGPWTGRGPP